MGVVVTGLVGHLGTADIGAQEQFFGAIDPQIVEIIPKGNAHLLAENRTEVVRTEAKLSGHFIHLQIRISKVAVDIGFSLLNRHRAFVVGLAIAKNQGTGNDAPQFTLHLVEGGDPFHQVFDLLDLRSHLADLISQIAHELSNCQNDVQKHIMPHQLGVQRIFTDRAQMIFEKLVEI